MGFFDRFKKQKPTDVPHQDVDIARFMTADLITLNSFRKEYIWGFTAGNPMRYWPDKNSFYNLVKLATGANGTITIGASFHPYQLLSKDGADVWEKVFHVIQANKYCDVAGLVREKWFFHMNPPGPGAFPLHVWPDERLLTEVNPEFATYVPFAIPYLTFENGKEPVYATEINAQVERSGFADEYIEAVTQAARFLLPAPSMVVGFGKFDNTNPSNTVSQYVDFLHHFLDKTS